MKSPQLLLFIATAATAAGSRGNNVVQAPKLPHRSELKVKRHLLQEVYPAFETFKGDMYAGMIPAILIDDGTSNSEDFSSYMFWLFQPDADAADVEVSCSDLIHWHCN
jgi:carboxypeptidase C (cathepsin A)